MRAAEEQSNLRAEARSSRRSASELEVELHAAREAAQEQAEKVVEVHKNAEAEIAAERLRRQEDVVEFQAVFAEQREALIEQVVARFEQEHFRLSATAAAEVERRRKAEEDAAEMRARLKAMQEQHDEQQQRDEEAAGVAEALREQQHQLQEQQRAAEAAEKALQEEALSLRLADLEGELQRATATEAERLELVAVRVRDAVAQQNETINELKDELWRREQEILKTRGILGGLSEVRRPSG